MLAPIYCNTFELQTLYVEGGHELVVVKFYYQEPPINEANPFPHIPFAPAAIIILERKAIKAFLGQMRLFLAQQEEHRK